MDKKNTTIGVVLLCGALGMMFWQGKQERAYQETMAQQQHEDLAKQVATATAHDAADARQQTDQSAQDATRSGTDTLYSSDSSVNATPAPKPDAPEERPVLENKFIRVEFTTWGGAIRSVTFKDYRAHQDNPEPYIFNEEADFPALAIDTWQGGSITPDLSPFTIKSKSDGKIVFSGTIAPGVELLRSYEISVEESGPAPYTIRHTTTVINHNNSVWTDDNLMIDLGLSIPDKSDSYGYNLNAGYYNGDSFIYERVSHFKGGGLFSSGSPKAYENWTDNVVWATTKNQFFASILTPDKPAAYALARPVQLAPGDNDKPRTGLSAVIGFKVPAIGSGQRADISMDCYIGPKEYRRLAQLDKHQDKVMQFGWSKPLGFIGSFVGFVGKLFYSGLCAVQTLTVNWGLAIILMTVIIRLIFWPLTAKAADTSRKMARLQGPLKEIQEKYKDNPKKRNEATLELWKKYKVNPAAGCLPVLIQMPIFIAFYYMLRGASELRFAHFLWISDLSLPDTVAMIHGFPLNILPFFMGASMLYQMHLAPTPNADPVQTKIMKFMPLIFMLFCYNFSSGLVLYWTVSNCMSILQQLHTNHKRNLEEAADAAAEAAKNGTAQPPVRHAKPAGKSNKKKK